MATPLRTVNCIDCTNKSSCFKKLSLPELKTADNKRLEVNYNKGETICKQGSFASHILYLKKGLVKIYLEGKEKNLVLAIVPKGHLIGIPSLFGDNIFHYSAVAYDDSTVCLIDISIFRKFTRENAKFSSELIQIINQSTISTYDRFFSLSQKNMPGRFADLILYLSEKIYNRDKFRLSFSRKDMAELASMSMESLSRIIKEFNNEGILETTGKQVIILNKEKLKQISKFS